MADTKSKSNTKSGVKTKTLSKPNTSAKPTAVPKSKTDTRIKDGKKPETAVSGVTFKCRLCEKQKPISEMKIVKRFRPVIFVCRDCEKTLQ